MRGSARTYLIALAAGGCLCLGAGTASAGTPAIACGATLTKSTTLTADLLSCPGTALVIGADGITVNLAGHTISGTNAKGSEGIANDGHAARAHPRQRQDHRLPPQRRRHAQGAEERRARPHHPPHRRRRRRRRAGLRGYRHRRFAGEPGHEQRCRERRQGLSVRRGRRAQLARQCGTGQHAEPQRLERPRADRLARAAGSPGTSSTTTGTTAPRSTASPTPPRSPAMARTATRPSASWSAPSGTSVSSATPPRATTPGCSSSICTPA